LGRISVLRRVVSIGGYQPLPAECGAASQRFAQKGLRSRTGHAAGKGYPPSEALLFRKPLSLIFERHDSMRKRDPDVRKRDPDVRKKKVRLG